jgi:phospholipase/carboxylesterase
MLAAPLPTVEINPTGEPLAAVIWLHGLGADGHDFEPIVPQLQLPADLPVRFVFPHAPEIAVTAFGGQVARAWFDFNPADRNAGTPGLAKSVLQVQDLIQAEIDSGTPPERIVLAGFSQGGALALRTALHYPRRLAGILALSTFLPPPATPPTAEELAANANTPILMCHGAQDMVLPLTLGETARDQLQTAGYNIEWQEYPMGHEVCMPEIQRIGAWLQEVLRAG